MQKNSKIVLFFLLGLLVLTFAACGSTDTRRSTGEYVDDRVITTRVNSQLMADDFLKSFQINVDTHEGTVQLSGFVDSQEAVNKAVSIARGVQGVTSVKNDLIVK